MEGEGGAKRRPRPAKVGKTVAAPARRESVLRGLCIPEEEEREKNKRPR